MDTHSPYRLSREDRFLNDLSTYARREARRRWLGTDETDDLAQEIVMECLANLRAGKDIVVTIGVESFARTMVKRRIVDTKRADSRRTARDSEFERERTEREHTWMSPEQTLDFTELEACIARTIASLPRRCRRVYEMLQENDATYGRVARALGISRTAVCAHVVTARRRIRAAVVKLGYEPSAVQIHRAPEHVASARDMAPPTERQAARPSHSAA